MPLRKDGLIDPEVKQGPHPDTCIMHDPHCECRQGQRCGRLADRPKGADAEAYIIDLLHRIDRDREEIRELSAKLYAAEERIAALTIKRAIAGRAGEGE